MLSIKEMLSNNHPATTSSAETFSLLQRKKITVDIFFPSWVVFEEPSFCGESYILEKGLYGNPEDWGALQDRIASVMPVVLVRLLFCTFVRKEK